MQSALIQFVNVVVQFQTLAHQDTLGRSANHWEDRPIYNRFDLVSAQGLQATELLNLCDGTPQ